MEDQEIQEMLKIIGIPPELSATTVEKSQWALQFLTLQNQRRKEQQQKELKDRLEMAKFRAKNKKY